MEKPLYFTRVLPCTEKNESDGIGAIWATRRTGRVFFGDVILAFHFSRSSNCMSSQTTALPVLVVCSRRRRQGRLLAHTHSIGLCTGEKQSSVKVCCVMKSSNVISLCICFPRFRCVRGFLRSAGLFAAADHTQRIIEVCRK